MHVPAGIDCLFLFESLLPQAGGKSVLRADVELDWYPPRPAAEDLIASRFRSASVSPRSAAGGAAITGGQRLIRPLVTVIDSMPATPEPGWPCPGAVDNYRVVLTPAVHGQRTVVVWGAPCGVADVTVGGRASLDLNGTDALYALVTRLLKEKGIGAADDAAAHAPPP
jgi:hypothetical protein